MTLQEAIGICGMAPIRYEYNLGVLTMLGQADLAITHRLAAESVDLQRMRIAQHHAHAGSSMPLLSDDELARATRLLARAKAQEYQAWAAIQSYIDRAQVTAGSAFAQLEH